MELNNTMWLAYRGMVGDEHIWGTQWQHLFSPAAWRSPTVIGKGAFNSTHGPALCMRPNGKVQMVWKGSGADQDVFTVSLQDGMPEQTPVPPVRGPQGAFQTIDRPAMAFEGSGRCILAWRAPNNELLWSSFEPFGGWDTQRATGATTSHGPVLVSREEQRIDTFEPDTRIVSSGMSLGPVRNKMRARRTSLVRPTGFTTAEYSMADARFIQVHIQTRRKKRYLLPHCSV